MKLYGINYPFPQVVVDRVAAKYPHASSNAISTAFQGFLDYVDICKAYPDDDIPMFSESVDEVWHQFILHTRSYQDFCKNYVGFFLHHVPNGKDSTPDYVEERKKLKVLWILACHFASSNPARGFGSIDPVHGSEIPDLFLADLLLGVDGAIDTQELRTEIALDLRNKSKDAAKAPGRFSAVKNLFRRQQEPSRSMDLSYDNFLTDYLLINSTVNASIVSEPTPSLHYEKFVQELIDSKRYEDSPSNSHDVSPSKHSSSHDYSPSSDHSSSHSTSSHSTSSHSSSYHSCSSSSSSHSSCSSSSSSCSSSSSSCSSSSCSS